MDSYKKQFYGLAVFTQVCTGWGRALPIPTFPIEQTEIALRTRLI
jgi:hypothetical protein